MTKVSANFSVFLCGGIFFSLLTMFVSKGVSSDAKLEGKANALSYPQLMKMLVDVGIDKEQEDQKRYIDNKPCSSSDVGHYKSCDLEDHGFGMPFQKGGPYIAIFNQNINNDYSGLAARMEKFLDFCMPTVLKDNRKNFVNALLAIIADDKSIDDEQEFLIDPTGDAVKKSAILEMRKICFESFITGVWHFCLCQRAGMNKQGKGTYNYLFKRPESNDDTKPNRRNVSLKKDFITNARREIEVIDLKDALRAAEQVLKNLQGSTKNDGSLNVAKFAQDSRRNGNATEEERVDAEFTDEKEKEKTSDSPNWGNVTYIATQINQGTNGKVFNIGNNGNVELHFGKDS